MIRLIRTNPPIEMTSAWVAERTAKFTANRKLRVWDEAFLKDALLAMSSNKCAYSEIRLQEEGKIMEVEHFLPKATYPDQVLQWPNLLPSSRHCNNAKLEKDPIVYPIVNPFEDNPKDHLYILDYILFGKTQKGKNSAIILKLNDPDHLLTPRREIGAAVRMALYAQFERIKRFTVDGLTSDEKLSITAALESLLKQGQAKEPYSATVATTILDDPHYAEIKTFVETNSFWSTELRALEAELNQLRLDTKP